jgi:type I restriction enzyme S subunit
MTPDPVPFCIAQDMVAARPNPRKVYGRYLFAALRSPVVQEQIGQMHVGSLIPHFKKGDFHRLLVPMIDPDAQRFIGDLYFNLSAKIDLNRRMNSTLEAIAKTLFESWFVDFDPVRTKSQGRQPSGMDAKTAALFPDRLVDSPIGLVPEGWSVGRLDDALLLQRGFDLPAREQVPGPFPVVYASGPSSTHHKAMVKGPGVTTGRSGTLGQVFLVHDDFWPHNTSLWVKEFRRSGPAHAYFLLRAISFGQFNAGSAVPTLNRNHVHSLPVVLAPQPIIDSFEMAAMTLLRRHHRNVNESHRLVAVRDALLPKLLSGELRVDEADRLVEVAT